jgi:acetylornithine deacetylase
MSARPTLSDIRAAIEALRPYMVETLTGFVACPSFSGEEHGAAVFMEGELEALGLACRRIPLVTAEIEHSPLYSPALSADANRYNLLASLEPEGMEVTGKSLLFNGHMDIVPTGPHSLWSSPPLHAREHQGRIFGRGAGDMKAGIVCAMTALKALQTLGLRPAARVAINTVLEEECTGNGALASLPHVRDFEAVVIPEPFNETLMSAQMGVLWCQFELTGKPAHAAYATSGVNPIEACILIHAELKTREAFWNQPEQRHPAYRDHAHPINFNLGRMSGGEWTSSVPCTATMEVRVGFFPGRSIDEVKTEIAEAAARALSNSPSNLNLSITHKGFHAPGCDFDLSHPSMRALSDAHQRVNGTPPRHSAMTATTDARFFRLGADMPVTCYGPEAENIHGVDESVSIASMQRVATVMTEFIVEWCKVAPLDASVKPMNDAVVMSH